MLSINGSQGLCVPGRSLVSLRAVRLWLVALAVAVAGSISVSGAYAALPAWVKPLDSLSCISNTGSGVCATEANGLDGAHSVAVSLDGKSVYIASSVDNAVAAFNRNSDGSLTSLGCIEDSGAGLGKCTTKAAALNVPLSVAVSPDGQSVYVASVGSDAVSIFDRSSDGSLTWSGCIESNAAGNGCATKSTAVSTPTSVAVSPDADGKSVYVTSAAGGSVAAFDRGPNGLLTPLNCVEDAQAGSACALKTSGLSGPDPADGPFSVTVSPDGKNVYATGSGGDAIVILGRASNGSLNSPKCVADISVTYDPDYPCDPAKGLDDVSAITVSPDGKNAYAISSSFDGAITRFNRSSNGFLTLSDCIAGAVGGGCEVVADGLKTPNAITMSPDGRSVYVSGLSGSESAVFAFVRDLSGGSLTPLGCVQNTSVVLGKCATKAPGLTSPVALVVSPDDKNLYAVSENGSDSAVTTLKRFLEPTCLEMSKDVKAGETVTVKLECWDINGDDLEIEIVPGGPLHGVLGSINQQSQTVTYTPDSGYAGKDVFTFRSSNTKGLFSQFAKVSLQVAPPPSKPATSDQSSSESGSSSTGQSSVSSTQPPASTPAAFSAVLRVAKKIKLKQAVSGFTVRLNSASQASYRLKLTDSKGKTVLATKAVGAKVGEQLARLKVKKAKLVRLLKGRSSTKLKLSVVATGPNNEKQTKTQTVELAKR